MDMDFAPLVSVIIPAYNLEDYIEVCVRSIMNQTYDNIEIIVVNDGSVDRTGEICDKLAGLDSRVICLHQKNGGVVAARGAGLDIAGGQYILFVDGDDWIEANMIDYMVKNIGNSELISVGVIREMSPNYEVVITDLFEEGIYSGERLQYLFSKMIYDDSSNKIQPYTGWGINKLFLAERAKEIFPQLSKDLTLAEDSVFLYMYMLTCKQITIKHEALYHYRYREESAVNKVDQKILYKHTQIYEALKPLLDRQNEELCLPEQLQHWFVASNLRAINKKMGFGESVHVTRYVADLSYLENKKIVLYAAGEVGLDYYRQLKQFGYNVVLWVDKHCKKRDVENVEVVLPEVMLNVDFDVVFIAIERADTAELIRRDLLNMGIGKERIVWRKPYILY